MLSRSFEPAFPYSFRCDLFLFLYSTEARCVAVSFVDRHVPAVDFKLPPPLPLPRAGNQEHALLNRIERILASLIAELDHLATCMRSRVQVRFPITLPLPGLIPGSCRLSVGLATFGRLGKPPSAGSFDLTTMVFIASASGGKRRG